VVTEDPALVDAGQRPDALHAEWQTANTLRAEARAIAEKLCQPIPEEIVCEGSFWAGCTETETDIEGNKVRQAREILDSANTLRQIEIGGLHCDGRTTFGKKLKRMIETAKSYEAAREAAIEKSGFFDHRERAVMAGIELGNLAHEVAEIEPRTMAGVAVQARALCAYAEAEDKWDDITQR